MKKEFFIAVVNLLTIVTSYGQDKQDILPNMIVIAAKKLEGEFELKQVTLVDKRNCDCVLFNVENKYDQVKTSSIAGHEICVLSKEEIFLNNISNYIEIISYSIQSKTSVMELDLVETSTKSSPQKKTKFNFKFKKKRGKWFLQ